MSTQDRSGDRAVESEDEAGITAGDPPSFFFICVFWGDQYWREFCRICLASMLAPGNIPSLDEEIRASSRFVIVTTTADWEALQDDPTFVLMKSHIEPLFIELPRPCDGDSKMNIMSRGHALASEAAFGRGLAASI